MGPRRDRDRDVAATETLAETYGVFVYVCV